MAWDWRRSAIAALAAGALAIASGLSVEAQTVARNAKKKPAEAADADSQAEQQAKAKKKRQDPVEAQRAIEAALKALEAGKSEQAVQALSAVLTGGNLPPAIMAKAMLYRGIAYRQQQKPAQAIADLTSALWLKGGLSETDRKDALKQRASAYQEAGLSETGETPVAAVPGAARTKTASAATTSWGQATTTSQPPASAAPTGEQAPAAQTNGGWNLFGNLFGGSSSQQQQQPAAPAPVPAATATVQQTAATAAPRPEPRTSSSSGWASNTEVRGSAAMVTAAIPTRPEGKFRVQLGMVRTQAEAEALAARVRREHMAALAREPEIDQAVVGNMGSFYRVRVGPYATQQESQAVCAKLKGSGLDCLLVTQ